MNERRSNEVFLQAFFSTFAGARAEGQLRKGPKHCRKSGERMPAYSSSVAHAAVAVQHGLSGTFESAGMNLHRVAKKQKVMKVESSS